MCFNLTAGKPWGLGDLVLILQLDNVPPLDSSGAATYVVNSLIDVVKLQLVRVELVLWLLLENLDILGGC